MGGFDPRQFSEEVLESNGIQAAFGVPDSSLSGLLSFFSATKPAPEHIVAANEGAAIGLAAGYFLATRRPALAYLQNSGLANALNPLQSMTAKEVFGLPMLMLIGWRGKPGEKDEPQHALIGPRLLDNLKANEFPYEEVPDTLEEAKEAVARLLALAIKDNTPVALIVPRKTFKEYQGPSEIPPAVEVPHVQAERWFSHKPDELPLSRELAIRHSYSHVKDTDVSISSLGGNSRELYMILKEKNLSLSRNFFLIGAMGHAFALSHGVSMAYKKGKTFCIDGDGSFLMHIGNNAVLAGSSNLNVVHVVIYNSVYSSTGNQPLMISRDHFLNLAEGLPYRQKYFVDNGEALDKALEGAEAGSLIVVLTNELVSDSLPRPTETSMQLRNMFMQSFHLPN
jgi:phosphonopyruvate decarboxylase